MPTTLTKKNLPPISLKQNFAQLQTKLNGLSTVIRQHRCSSGASSMGASIYNFFQLAATGFSYEDALKTNYLYLTHAQATTANKILKKLLNCEDEFSLMHMALKIIHQESQPSFIRLQLSKFVLSSHGYDSDNIKKLQANYKSTTGLGAYSTQRNPGPGAIETILKRLHEQYSTPQLNLNHLELSEKPVLTNI